MRPIVTCARCEEERPYRARDLCVRCYDAIWRQGPDALAEYPPTKSHSMEVDHVQVDRAVQWVTAFVRTVSWADRNNPEYRTGRPRLSRGEKIEVLRGLPHGVSPWRAAAALGISGGYATRYLEAAAVAA